MKGGYINLRHNIGVDLTADLLREVASDIRIEPKLTLLRSDQVILTTAKKEDSSFGYLGEKRLENWN